MKRFYGYRHPAYGIKIVKHGFSWFAFLLPPIWGIYHKVWWALALWIGYWIAAFVCSVMVGVSTRPEFAETVMGWAQAGGLAVGLVYGDKANRWLRKSLANRGYRKRDIYEASSADAALAMMLEDEKAEKAASAAGMLK